MKSLISAIFILCVSGASIAQESTCKSRCEEQGLNITQCESICKNFKEDSSARPRKKATSAVSAASLSSASTTTPAQASASSSIPQAPSTVSTAKKENPAATTSSTPSVKKENWNSYNNTSKILILVMDSALLRGALSEYFDRRVSNSVFCMKSVYLKGLRWKEENATTLRHW